MPMDSLELAHAANVLQAERCAAAAPLAAAIIAAMGRPVSLEDVTRIHSDVFMALFPNNGHGRYDQWKATHDWKKRYV